jgi:hypothetical protein
VSKNEQKFTILPQAKENTIQEQPKSTKNTPRDPPKLHFYCITSGCKLQQDYRREMGERERGREEFGQHIFAMKLHPKMRRGGLLLKEGMRREPP